ncbi:hypothetical protein SAMN05720591_13320 [Halolactibacillus alkaliphilus]|nr:hypothetical protein SAMN05720591_13320 [Halolactibacillus alkaliphilus]
MLSPYSLTFADTDYTAKEVTGMKQSKRMLPIALSIGVGAMTYLSMTNNQSKDMMKPMMNMVKKTTF